MVSVPTEKRYEKYIETELINLIDDGLQFHSKIHKKNDTWYDKELCLVGDEFMTFLKESQPDVYENLSKKYTDSLNQKVLSRLNKEIESKGLIHVLRKGFNDVYGGNIKTVYFQPNSSLNKKYRDEKYLKNRFLLVRQLHYSPHNNNSIDIAIFINGIPILTVELKNQLTGQSINDSDAQYKMDRNPRGEPLLKFQRCICHFSVDNDMVNMTTKLNGDKTFFLPYNKTFNNLETESDGYKVEYLWKEILTPTSLLDIIENFVLFTYEIESVWSDEKKKVVEQKKPVLIFPRYHQLDVIRKLKEQVIKDDVGNNYLIQHTTGSGKSYEIGWLSFMLTNLFKNDEKDRVFDSIIVITDRKVLDKQLQDTVKSIEKVDGVVEIIDKNSQQLRESLSRGKNIIVTTIQKFSVVVNRIQELDGKSFAVIVDEVHSSQGGKRTKNLQKTLSVNKEDDLDITDDMVNNEILTLQKEMKSHQKQDHISFFGFTGTPKPQTLEVFGTPQLDGSKKPFHTYTMKQSIGEGFTLDVLKSFTSVKRYFKLRSKDVDIELPEKRGKKELIKWADSNPETIRRKVTVILDHLLNHTVKSINGQGKGMLIVRSIPDTVKYHNEINKQLKDRGVHNKVKTLIGFSGKTDFNGQEITEKYINKENGYDGSDIPKGFKNPIYRLLIVCDKFQTGFNEPLLHTMFIDKPLQGVQCVQTLSRLNRKMKGKTNTFILDFVNRTETVKLSFQDFYQTTILSEDSDPNSIYDLLDKIRDHRLFTSDEIEEWSEIYVKEDRDDSKLQPILNDVIERWRMLEEDDDKELSKSQIRSYCKLFSYLSMINEFNNIELYRHYLFFEYLKKKFPLDGVEKVDVSDLVDLESLDLVIKDKDSISLEDENAILDPYNPGDGKVNDIEEYQFLSEILQDINEFFGNVPEGTEESSKKLIEDLVNDDEFNKILKSDNTLDNKKDKLNQIYKQKNIKTLDDNQKLYEIFNKKEMRDKVINTLISKPEVLQQFQT